MPSSTISLGLGLGGGKSATSSGAPGGGGGAFANAKSLSFDATDERMTADLGITVGSQSAYTVAFWAKANTGVSNGTGPVRLNTKATRATTTADTNLLRFNGTNVDGTLKNVEVYHKAATNSYAGITIVTAAHGISADTWFHYAQSWDGTTVSAYINGVAKGSSSKSVWIPMDTGTTIQVEGGWGWGSAWNGYVDEIAYWTSALSASDIGDIGSAGEAIDLSDYSPLSWWRMGDFVDGSTIPDQRPAGHDGTLVNSPTVISDVPS